MRTRWVRFSCRLSTRNDEPERASRPWDEGRDGFVLADGAGAMILESYEHAVARGATIYAELSGFAMSSDAYHMTLPADDSDGAKRCMELAMADAGVNPSDVDYINAHGTSTPAGDVAETRAIKYALGTLLTASLLVPRSLWSAINLGLPAALRRPSACLR